MINFFIFSIVRDLELVTPDGLLHECVFPEHGASVSNGVEDI